jgi:phage protein D
LGSNNVRSPALAVFVNGSLVPGILDAEIASNSYQSANRYRVRASLAATGYTIWSSDEVQIEIRLGLDGAWTSMILGPVDRISVDPALNEVMAEGRDLTASLIEARTQESFENQTSSDIATILAARHGLLPVVTPTTTFVGRNFQNDHVRSTLDQHARSTTEWDLLVRLAELEGFDVWVDGQALYFAPLAADPQPLLLTPQDCISMRLDRSTALSAGLSVSVKSWDCRGSQAISQTASTGGFADGAAGYVVVRPNMTSDAAQGLANRLVALMAQQGRVVIIEMPGDLTTAPRGTLAIADTDTDFDGVYMITSVERRMSFEHGFYQTVEARMPPWTIF